MCLQHRKSWVPINQFLEYNGVYPFYLAGFTKFLAVVAFWYVFMDLYSSLRAQCSSELCWEQDTIFSQRALRSSDLRSEDDTNFK